MAHFLFLCGLSEVIKDFDFQVHSVIYLTLCHTVFILPQHAAYNAAHICFSQVKTNTLQQFNNRYSIMHFTISALESPFSEEQCLVQPVLCNEAGWELPAPLVSCSSAVPRDIHLVSLVWLVNLVGGEILPPLITSAQSAAFNRRNGHAKLCLCHHNQVICLNRTTQLLREFPSQAFQLCYN